VTVHQSPISVNGWQGSGYSVLDPEKGVGAYQISGGASGGFLKKAKNFISYISTWYQVNNSLLRGSPVWYAAKGLLKTFSILTELAINIQNFVSKCSSLSAAIGLSLVFSMISAAITIALFFAPFMAVVVIAPLVIYAQMRLESFFIEDVGC